MKRWLGTIFGVALALAGDAGGCGRECTRGGVRLRLQRIIAAIDQRWPPPPLYPEDERQRRRGLRARKYFDEELGLQIRRAIPLRTHARTTTPHGRCAGVGTDGHVASAIVPGVARGAAGQAFHDVRRVFELMAPHNYRLAAPA